MMRAIGWETRGQKIVGRAEHCGKGLISMHLVVFFAQRRAAGTPAPVRRRKGIHGSMTQIDIKPFHRRMNNNRLLSARRAP
jgi:hypothetical protein